MVITRTDQIRRLFKHVLIAIGYGAVGSALILAGGYIYLQESRPDLKPWHRADLNAEFRAAMAEEIDDLDAYRRLEDRLFLQLQERVYDRVDAADRSPVNRYSTGSLLDPQGYPGNWNRTFEFPADDATAGVLLLHGLSDSPYSLRALGESFRSHKLWVVGLRLPGHGTAPSGLLEFSWQDHAAAVRMAARHIRNRIGPEPPLYIVGYSNGAALAVEYTLAVLEGEDLPPPAGLIMLSPAIGVSRLAAFAIWQERLSRLSGLEKLAWNEILLEVDPYKYNSFTVNAGDQIFQLTRNIAGRIDKLAGRDGVQGFPRSLAFQSVVDATTLPATLIDALFMKLAPEGHELVLFDVNRHAESEPLLRTDPEDFMRQLFAETELPFGLTLLTNVSPGSNALVARYKPAGSQISTDRPLDLAWPPQLFSLSHVAIPFPPDDPVYGGVPYTGSDEDVVTLGSISLRGERNLLLIPDSYFLRLRYNPFFTYLEEKVIKFLGSRE